MSSETTGLRLQHIEVPLAPGTRLAISTPGDWHGFGPEPLLRGQGFTIDVNGDRWRAVLLEAAVQPGGIIRFDLEVEGRY